jgi:hypothetical protein
MESDMRAQAQTSKTAVRPSRDRRSDSRTAPVASAKADDRQVQRQEPSTGRVDALLRANPSLVHEIE